MDDPIAQAVEEMAWIDQMRDDNVALRTENERLRLALKPFARAAPCIQRIDNSLPMHSWRGGAVQIWAFDFYRARAALEGTE